MRGDVLKTIGRKIYFKAKLKGLNKSLIAKKLGCNLKTVSRHIDKIIKLKNLKNKITISELNPYWEIIKGKVLNSNSTIVIYEYVKE